MSTSPNKPKLLDIARHAGVSMATVSRVINNTAPVNERTRSRVLASLRALGYRSSLERGAEQSAQGLIALLITDILNPFFPEIVRGVEDDAGPSGLALLLCNTSEDPQRERQALRVLAEQKVEGIIACASRVSDEDLIALHARNNTPLVVINRRVDHASIPCILVDFEDAAYRAAKHLTRLGHTRIAYLAGDSRFKTSLARRRGIEQALREVGLDLRPEWCVNSFPNTEGGFQAMSGLLAAATGVRPTAVITYNDIIALGALHAIRTHHLHIPEDISVVGCDGIAMAAHANPPLTTIDQPKYRMGQLAMQMLRRLIAGQPIPNGYTLMESPLVVRESTAPPPSGERII
jgi:LacI family transcriptional regulator